MLWSKATKLIACEYLSDRVYSKSSLENRFTHFRILAVGVVKKYCMHFANDFLVRWVESEENRLSRYCAELQESSLKSLTLKFCIRDLSVVCLCFDFNNWIPDLQRDFLKNPPEGAGHGLKCIEFKKRHHFDFKNFSRLSTLLSCEKIIC